MKKIYIEITNSCNLNCNFCQNTNREKEFMSIQDFEKIIIKIKDYTKIVCLHVKGEPFLHPKLEQILNILNKYDLKANITTNGTLMNQKSDILLKSNSVRQLNLSLHSILENENIDLESYMKDIFVSVDKLKSSKIIISYRLWNLSSLENNEKNIEIIKLLGKKYGINNLVELLRKNEWIKLDNKTFINQDTRFIWPNLNNKIINEHGRCLALKEQIAILVNGDAIPCCIDSEGEMVLGNILSQNLNDILSSQRVKNLIDGFQKRELNEELCKRCGFLYRLENKRK